MNHRISRAAPLALGVFLATGQAALGVDPLNEFAASITTAVSPVYDGLKGNLNTRTDPATISGIAYVHITQADVGSPGGTFIAIGVANGAGVDNCADDYDSLWTGYYDGEIGGLYFCEDFDHDFYGVGSNPNFKIYYETGALCGGNRWILTLNGITRACLVTSGSSAQHVNVGLEVVSYPPDPTDRNIDVKFTNLYMNLTNGTNWLELGTPQWLVDDFYTKSWVSNTAENFYLAPLN